MLKKFSVAVRATIMVLVIYLAAAMIVSPTACINAAIKALHICAEVVIPSLFPFIFCGNMFIALGAARIMSKSLSGIMKPIFGVSGAGALALVLGVVSGYPVGASCAAELYRTGECTRSEAERLLAFCNNSGPMFIIGAVGTGMLGSHRLGVLLYLTHIFAALLCGMIFRGWGRNERTHLLPAPRDENDIKTAAPDIGAAVGKSVDTILIICGFIIIFAVFTAVFPYCDWRKYVYAVLEITGGVHALTASGTGGMTLPLAAMFIAFSGISVLAQVSAIVIPSGLSVVPYVLGKLTQAMIAFVLTFLAIRIIPCPTAAISADFSPIAFSVTPRQLLGTAITTIAFSALTIASLIAAAKIFEHYRK